MDRCSYGRLNLREAISPERSAMNGANPTFISSQLDDHPLNYRFNLSFCSPIYPITTRSGKEINKREESSNSRPTVSNPRVISSILLKCHRILEPYFLVKDLVTAHAEGLSERTAEAPTSQNFDNLRTVRAARLPSIGMSSRQDCESVINYLQSLSAARLALVSPAFTLSSNALMRHELGIKISQALISLSPEFTDECIRNCSADWLGVLQNKHSFLFVQNLLQASESLKTSLLQTVLTRMDELVELQRAMQHLIYLLPARLEDGWILSAVWRISEWIKPQDPDALIITLLLNLVRRSSKQILQDLGATLRPHLPWLVDHEVGYQVVKLLIQKNDLPTVEALVQIGTDSPVQFFVKKYRKVLFLQYLLSGNRNGAFFQTLIHSIKKNRSDIRYLLKKEESCLILHALLHHLIETNPQIVSDALARIINIQASDPLISDQAFVRELIQDFECFVGRSML